tara:strand:- start:562 stop:1062 length:501 start_codon:yes stop_codon:yes gene_type:complete
MTIHKSTKIGLAVAGFALVAQLTNSLISQEVVSSPINEPTTQTQHIQTSTASTAFNECMNTRGPRTYEERSATDRSATERKSRTEIYAERQAKCEAEQQASATNNMNNNNNNNNVNEANGDLQTTFTAGGSPYTGVHRTLSIQKVGKSSEIEIKHIMQSAPTATQP